MTVWGEIMISVVLAAAVLCASTSEEARAKGLEQAEIHTAERAEGRSSTLGPPGGMPPARGARGGDKAGSEFLAPDKSNEITLRALPHETSPGAKYKPKVWLGPGVRQPSIEEIRLKVASKLEEAGRKQQPAGDLAD
jgi:hypothetical protein